LKHGALEIRGGHAIEHIFRHLIDALFPIRPDAIDAA
jgi:hypothetical protein